MTIKKQHLKILERRLGILGAAGVCVVFFFVREHDVHVLETLPHDIPSAGHL